MGKQQRVVGVRQQGRVGLVYLQVVAEGGWNGQRMVAWASEPWAVAILKLGMEEGQQDNVAATLLDLERGREFFPSVASSIESGATR